MDINNFITNIDDNIADDSDNSDNNEANDIIINGAMETTFSRKLSVSDIFDCSDINNFISTIRQVLPFKGFSMSKFFTCEFQGTKFLTKLCFYRKTPPEIYSKPDKKRESIPWVDAEIRILTIFKEKIIEKRISPCILELVYYKICNNLSKFTPREKLCERLMLEYHEQNFDEDVEQLFCKYNDLIKNQLAHNKCAFLVLEKCDMALEDYLKKSINTPVSLAVFKSLLFQIIYTFYAICKIYPNFRHYDLHTDNIMLRFDPSYKFKATNPKFLIYYIDGEVYSIPYFGIIPKIIDFGFSVIPEENIISNATDDKVLMYYRSHNDLLMLFHHIHHVLAAVDQGKVARVDKILSALEPNRTYIHFNTEYIRKIEDILPSYESMVHNNIFREYRKYTVPKAQIYDEFGTEADIKKSRAS